MYLTCEIVIAIIQYFENVIRLAQFSRTDILKIRQVHSSFNTIRPIRQLSKNTVCK